MYKNYILILFLIVILGSCCFSSKNTSLGKHLYVSEFSVKELQIMYCDDECCPSGQTVIPETFNCLQF